MNEQPFSQNNSPEAQPIAAASVPEPTAQAATQGQQAPTEVESLLKTRSNGAGWFFWIVGLSILNALLILFNSDKTLAIGLNSTLFLDVMAQEGVQKHPDLTLMWRGIELVGDLLIFAFYAFCGVMAARGKTWAFWLGGIAFAVDTLFSLAMQEWIGLAIHLWALASIFFGLQACKKLIQLEKAAAAEPSPWAA